MQTAPRPAPLPFPENLRRKKVLTILKITKHERNYLVSNGLRPGPDGDIHHTVARHRRTYYMTESAQAMRLHEKYYRSLVISSHQNSSQKEKITL